MSRSPVACALLAEELKTLRERTGLSFAALGAKTLYSKSSWSRYLNGEALPPWKAVQALCELAGEAEPRLRAMWELAEQEWSRRDAVGAGAAATAGVARTADTASTGCAVGRSAADAVGSGSGIGVGVGTVPQTAVAVQTEAAPPTSSPPPSPARSPWHQRLSRPPGWAYLVIGVVLASVVFGIGSWYRSGEPAPSATAPPAGPRGGGSGTARSAAGCRYRWRAGTPVRRWSRTLRRALISCSR